MKKGSLLIRRNFFVHHSDYVRLCGSVLIEQAVNLFDSRICGFGRVVGNFHNVNFVAVRGMSPCQFIHTGKGCIVAAIASVIGLVFCIAALASKNRNRYY